MSSNHLLQPGYGLEQVVHQGAPLAETMPWAYRLEVARDEEDGLRFGERPAPEGRRIGTSVAVVLLLAAGCADDGDVESAEGDPETIVEEAQEQDFEELVVDEPFEGTAVVTEIVSPRAFRLFDTLVVSEQALDLRTDERAVVRGTVRDTTIDELEQQLGIELGDAVADAHDGGLLIVADEVRPVDFPEPLD